MSTAKNAILKAKIEGVIQELMVKTDAANVYVDDSTTLAAKLTSIIADIATKASTTELTEGLATKANASHTHAQSEVTGLTEALALLASTESVNSAIDALRQEMLGDTPVEAYNTFTELAQYIEAHQEVSDALSAAIGTKADKATTLAGYDITDAYTKTETDQKITDALDDNVFSIPITLTKDSGGYYVYVGTTTVTQKEVGAAFEQNKQIILDTNLYGKIYPYSIKVNASGGGMTINAICYPFNNATVYRIVVSLNIDSTAVINDIHVQAFDVAKLTINDESYMPFSGNVDFTDTINTMIDTKISSATGGESAASVKAALDTYKTSNDTRVEALEADTHTHANKTVLDGITAENVTSWSGKSKIYYSATEPSDLTEQDLWVQFV